MEEPYSPHSTEIYGDTNEGLQDTWQDTLLNILSLVEAHTSEGRERHLKAVLARALEDAYHHDYRENDMEACDMANDLKRLLAEHSIRSSIIDAADSAYAIPGKRQPGIEESIVATLERFQFIEQLESTFGEKIDGIVVGGSMSYGPFFNVRGGEDGSDIDAIFVMNESFHHDSEWREFRKSEIIADQDKETFLNRKRIFTKLAQRREADILSQKFVARNGNFNMSAHIMSRKVFDRIFSIQLETDMTTNSNVVSVLRDYTPKQLERALCNRLGFDGGMVDFAAFDQGEVEHGYVTTVPAYLIDNGRYYPGLYQCLLLPSMLVVYDKTGFVGDSSKRFLRLMTDRLNQERQVDPEVSILKAHPRRIILAPGRYEK